jgi:hypothetical protein
VIFVRGPSSAELMDVLDRGVRASSAERALLLLETFRSEATDELAAMPLGWVTACLLEFRSVIIGPALECLSNCCACGTEVECNIPVKQLTAAVPERAASGESLRMLHDDYIVEFRLPGCADLVALEGNPDSAAQSLAQKIIGSVSRAGKAVPMAEVPAGVRTALERAVLEHDPLVSLELELSCPGCGREWTETLDIVDFIWRELSIIGQRLLTEVARLACAFGWRECDILAMSEQRRHRYLELLPS